MSSTFYDTTRTRHRRGNGATFLPRKKTGNAAAPVVMAVLVPTSRSRQRQARGREETGRLYIDETANIRLDNSNTTHNPQKLLCFSSLNTGICPWSYKSYSFRCGVA